MMRVNPSLATLYVRSILDLRPIQIVDRVTRALRVRPALPRDAPPLRVLARDVTPPCERAQSAFPDGSFVFLNETRLVSRAADWNDPAADLLWLYNLHYFDDLGAANASLRLDRQAALIARWIAENPPWHGAGWQPYPIALRSVNWIKWQVRFGAMSSEACASLFAQGWALEHQLEYHLLANHLFADAKALVFLGIFFAGEQAERWLERGLAILRKELPEQILADGGHFERSPMYQAIIAEDMLDLIWLAQLAPAPLRARLPVEQWRATAAAMLAWLKVMIHPDGEISFFNDAAFGVAPRYGDLCAYARRLGADAPQKPLCDGIHVLAASGYVRLQKRDAVVLFDAAPLGPRYQPGHAHADTLSFEMSLQGQRVLVNSGTSRYAAGAERSYERGTAAHNTLVVDDRDSSEVWSAFRVARRARPLDLRWSDNGETLEVSAGHDGFRRQVGGPIHRRRIVLTGTGLRIEDHLSAGRWRSARSYLHLAPGVVPACETDRRSGTLSFGSVEMDWKLEGASARVEPGFFRPQFNRREANAALVGDLDGAGASFDLRWNGLARP